MRQRNNDTSKERKSLLPDEKKVFILDFLKSAGMSYTMSGRKEQVYVGKDENNNRQYKPKWTFKEMLSMLKIDNRHEQLFFTKFGEKIKFSTVYQLVKETKELYYQGQIPESSYLCEKFENCELLRAEIKKLMPNLFLYPH